MKIAVRVDASADIGTGHVRRSIALAKALATAGCEVRFVTRDLGIDSASMIESAGFSQTAVLDAPPQTTTPELPAPGSQVSHAGWAGVSAAQDIKDTAAALNAFSPDWLVVDTYAFDARWHRGVAKALNCRIAVIDDLADRALDCELVIDHTYARDHRAKYAGVAPSRAKILGGPTFALLGAAFADAPRYAFNNKVRSIGVFMGGVDAGNHSETVIDALDAIGFDGAVEVVTTSANPHINALRETISARANTTLSTDLPDLAAFFARHDLQIGAGGGASWERCCIGVPTLLVVVAQNQLSVAPQLAEDGIAVYAADPSPGPLAASLKSLIADAPLRRALSEKSRQLVDGLGADRVALAMLAPTVKLRNACIEDARIMFDWRNHKATRAVSGTKDELDWEDHVAWLKDVLADEARTVFIGQIGNRAVGVIRFDYHTRNRAEVSLYCDPALLGLGLGPELLLAGEAKANPAIIDATVLEGNDASQALFVRCGYHRTSATTFEKHRLPSPETSR